jgi:Tol biopolymer transport system component
MRNRSIVILSFLVSALLAACASNSIIEEPDIPREPPKPLEVEPPLKEVHLDYGQLELEIAKIQQVERKPGLFNSYNPQFTTDEQFLAFEVNLGNYKKIHIYRMDVQEHDDTYTVNYHKAQEVFLEESFGGELTDDIFESSTGESFNYEFSWFPRSNAFIFTSNAGLGEYNLFVGSVEEDDTFLKDIRKRFDPKPIGNYFMITEEMKKDGQAKVSPDGSRIVFTSGRTGNGDLYLYDLELGSLKRMTSREDTDFFPRWSPDGSDIVYTTGGKQSHDIHIIRKAGTLAEEDVVLVKWFFDDVLPSYSPDGKYISFYTTYNRERDPFNTKRWGIMIVPSDGSAPKAGMELIPYFHAADVVKDNMQGTAWFPDSRHLLYAKNIDSDYNPIYIYDIEERSEKLVETGTDINHDLTVSPHGLVSFRAQLFGWDRIFIASTSYFQEYLRELYAE